MLGFKRKKRREQEELRRKEREALVETQCTEAYKAGYKGTAEQFLRILKNPEMLIGNSNENTDFAIRSNLQQGAIHALQEGRPENAQLMFCHQDKSVFETTYMIQWLIQGKDTDAAASIIHLATEKFSKPEQQTLLDDALLDLVKGSILLSEKKDALPFAEALLKAGANASAHDGRILAMAIAKQSPAVVNLLRTHGAEYKDAALLMRLEKWEKHYWPQFSAAPTRLRDYQLSEQTETMEQLRQNLRDVTGQLESAKARICDLESGQTTAPAKTQKTPPPPQL